MSRLAFFFICFAVLIAGFHVGSARADYFLWEDPDTGLTLSFPDSWQLASNVNPSTMLTLKAPAPAQDYATCKVRVEDETRYLSYPPINDKAVQRVMYGNDFWERRVATFPESKLLKVYDQAALGRRAASYAVADYQKKIGYRNFIDMRGIMFASLYYDKVYFFECESVRHEFRYWKEMFLSIAKSIDYQKVHHELPNGNFRYFLGEDIMMFDPTGVGTTTY